MLSLTLIHLENLVSKWIIELPRKGRRSIHVKIDDGFIEEQSMNVIGLNIFHIHELRKKNIVKLNAHDTDVIIDVIFKEKRFPASGYLLREIQ